MKTLNTIHTSRTIMFSELSKVMDHGIKDGDFIDVLRLNVVNKLSNSNLRKTNHYLKQLYLFNNDDLSFKCFKKYWQVVNNENKNIITLLYALKNDFLLRDSIDLVVKTNIGEEVIKRNFVTDIEKQYPGRYSENTRKSTTRNIISSWKQAGYIQRNIKNNRIKPDHNLYTVAFAMLMSYLNGDRGEYILSSKFVRTLALNNEELTNFIKEAAVRDLLKYQSGGNVLSISFDNQIINF